MRKPHSGLLEKFLLLATIPFSQIISGCGTQPGITSSLANTSENSNIEEEPEEEMIRAKEYDNSIGYWIPKRVKEENFHRLITEADRRDLGRNFISEIGLAGTGWGPLISFVNRIPSVGFSETKAELYVAGPDDESWNETTQMCANQPCKVAITYSPGSDQLQRDSSAHERGIEFEVYFHYLIFPETLKEEFTILKPGEETSNDPPNLFIMKKDCYFNGYIDRDRDQYLPEIPFRLLVTEKGHNGYDRDYWGDAATVIVDHLSYYCIHNIPDLLPDQDPDASNNNEDDNSSGELDQIPGGTYGGSGLERKVVLTDNGRLIEEYVDYEGTFSAEFTPSGWPMKNGRRAGIGTEFSDKGFTSTIRDLSVNGKNATLYLDVTSPGLSGTGTEIFKYSTTSNAHDLHYSLEVNLIDNDTPSVKQTSTVKGWGDKE